MRILHVVHQYPPDHVGGTELYTRAMAQRQAAAGHEVAVFCPESGPGAAGAPVEEAGVRVYRAGRGRRGRASVFLSTLGAARLAAAFDAVLAAERPDVVHLQHLMGLPASMADQIAASGIPYIITLHDYWYGCANAQLLTNYDETPCVGPDARFNNCGRCALARAGLPAPAAAATFVAPLMARRNRTLRPIFDGAAAVLASTPFVRQAHAAMGFPAGRIDILPLGADVSPAQIAAAREARHRREPDSSFHIGYVGGLSRQKGVHVLVAAVNRLPERATLSLYGDPAADPGYVAELRAAAGHPGIRFEGRLQREALWPALGALDVLVLPTLWYETYGLVVQEAFAAGVPVLASRIGVMPDVVADGVDGLLFPPGDAAALSRLLLELLENPALVDDMRANIPPVMRMDDHAARLETIYRAVRASAGQVAAH